MGNNRRTPLERESTNKREIGTVYWRMQTNRRHYYTVRVSAEISEVSDS